MKTILERDVEAALVKRVKELGGTCEKFTSPGRRSVPDRLVILPFVVNMIVYPKIVFVECKAPGKKPTEKQLMDHEMRRRMGCLVVVIDSIEAAKNFQ